MRNLLAPILIIISVSCTPQKGTNNQEISLRASDTCEALAKECYSKVGDGFDAVDCAMIEGCCEQIGTVCECLTPDIGICSGDTDCMNGSQCVDGWCVDAGLCANEKAPASPWLCPSQCVDEGGDPIECLESFACFDEETDYCVPCVVCDSCSTGCDYTTDGLTCKGNVDNDLVQPPTCIHLEAFNYASDIQWVQVRNVCQTVHNGKFELRWGGPAYEHAKPYSDPIQPGECVVLRNFEPRLGDPKEAGIAQAIGVFAGAAVLDAKYPRDAALYGFGPNKAGLATPDFIVHLFGFGGEHDIGGHAYRDSALMWGAANGTRPPDCK